MPAYNEPPDLDEIPKTPEAYRDGLYSEIRRARQMLENIFWVLLPFVVVVALTAGWALYQFELRQ